MGAGMTGGLLASIIKGATLTLDASGIFGWFLLFSVLSIVVASV
jgi:hypothetical protein